MHLDKKSEQSSTVKKVLCLSSIIAVLAMMTVAFFILTTKKINNVLCAESSELPEQRNKRDELLTVSASAKTVESPEMLFASIPEEELEIQTQPAAKESSSINMAVTGNWPSADYSMFNYKNETTWESNPSMGKGEKYPGLDKTCDSSKVSTQGIFGPTTAFKFSMPVEVPKISSFFGWRKIYGRTHYGTDFADKKGTPIIASERGTVTTFTTGKNSGSFGIFVELNHGDSFTTLYAHMSKAAVKAGDHVEKGDIIGYMGSTGATSANHLHFEIRHKGIPYNPFMGYMTLPEFYASGEAEPEDIFLSIPDEQ